MKTARLIPLLSWLVVTATAAPLIDEPIDVTLKNGKILHQAIAKSFAPGEVLVKHADGAETVPYDFFPDELRPALEAKRPAKRTESQIAADGAKARKVAAVVAKPAPRKVEPDRSAHGELSIESYKSVSPGVVEIVFHNTSDEPKSARAHQILGQSNNGEIVAGGNFVVTDGYGNVTQVLRGEQFVPANSSATYSIIFRTLAKGGDIQTVFWRK